MKTAEITADRGSGKQIPGGDRRGRLTLQMAAGLAAPHTFAASVCPALFGDLYCVYRHFPIHLPAAILLPAACILMQASVNTLNDYMDFMSGTDTAEDHVERSDSILVYSDLAPWKALALGMGFLLAAAVIGAVFTFLRGPAPLLVGIAGAAAVILYSAGPLPVSHLPIGELVSGFVMGGLIPLGITAAVTGEIHPEIFTGCIPFIIGIGLIMMTNNTCDIEKDLRAGRRTLPNRLGRQRAVALYRGLTVLWMLAIIAFAFSFRPAAAITAAMLLIPGYRLAFRYLLQSPVIPETRIPQMKGILKANLAGALICLTILTGCIAAGGGK